MKKGCFIKGIVGLTIIIAVIAYIIQNKFDEYILNPGKKAVAGIIRKQIDETAESFTYTPEKDSLKMLLDDLFDRKIIEFKNLDNKMFEFIDDSLEAYSGDKKLDSIEYKELKELIIRFENERPKKN